ncbi:MAG: hypothetical protein NOU37_06270 [Candidatus Brocadiales bacterium]|nr:hypothetical protein [Candidatus Bathyanammoxibius sp.]MCQ4574837.1 hypothetical protein [Candidatus Bathyanammoxibius amoris]
MKRSVIRTVPEHSLELIAIFAAFTGATAACLAVLFFIFNEITVPNVVNCIILGFVVIMGMVRHDRLGWFSVEIGSATNALVFFISYCLVGSDYSINYMYAIGFTLSMGTAGYFASVAAQQSYGLEKGPDRLEKEDFPHITKEEVEGGKTGAQTPLDLKEG